MVKVQRGVCEIYINHLIKDNIDFFLLRQSKNWDFLGLCIGEEGDGKTTLIQQLALYMDGNITLDNCVFSVEQFNKAVDTLPKGSAIIWDESDELDATQLRKVLLAVKRKFKRIRDRNFKIWLITPTFFDLNKYFIMHRIQCLIRVTADGLNRGYAYFYTKDRMRNLYLKGKKEWDVYCVRSNFSFNFTKIPKGFPIDQEAYDVKKHEAADEITDELETSSQKIARYRKECVKRYYRQIKQLYKSKPRQKDAAYIFGVERQTISTDIQEWSNAEVSADIDVKNSNSEVTNVTTD